MNGINKYSTAMLKAVKSVPISVWTVLTLVTGAFCNVFIAETVFNGMRSVLTLTLGTFIVMLFFMGIAYMILTRVAIRIVYAVASRLYFQSTGFVPDFNLRRLPLSYGEFCAMGLLMATVCNFFSAVFNLLIYVLPTAYYLWIALSGLIKVGAFVAGWFVVRGQVEEWQVGRVFLAVGIPTLVILVISVLGGV